MQHGSIHHGQISMSQISMGEISVALLILGHLSGAASLLLPSLKKGKGITANKECKFATVGSAIWALE